MRAVTLALASSFFIMCVMLLLCMNHCRKLAVSAGNNSPGVHETVSAYAFSGHPEFAFSLGFGAFLSVLVSLGIAFAFSRGPSDDARRLQTGLKDIARGKRDVRFFLSGNGHIHELKGIGESVSFLQERLAQEEELRRQWSQDIAHDLRTPVAALRAQLEAMRDGLLGGTPERFDLLLSESRRLEKIIDDLLCLAQVESPGFIPKPEPVSVSCLARNAANRLMYSAARSGHLIRVHSDEENSVPFWADPGLLDRALSNLIQNAVKYSPADSCISVCVRQSPRGCSIEVENPGRIRESELERIFDRLYRCEASRTTEGSGLGLPIARAIACAHGGSLSAVNAPGHIVRFSFVLPAKNSLTDRTA